MAVEQHRLMDDSESRRSEIEAPGQEAEQSCSSHYVSYDEEECSVCSSPLIDSDDDDDESSTCSIYVETKTNFRCDSTVSSISTFLSIGQCSYEVNDDSDSVCSSDIEDDEDLKEDLEGLEENFKLPSTKELQRHSEIFNRQPQVVFEMNHQLFLLASKKTSDSELLDTLEQIASTNRQILRSAGKHSHRVSSTSSV